MTASDGALLPDGWAELSSLIDQLLDAPDDQQAILLDSLSDGDTGRHASLAMLLLECQRGFPLLERPAVERFDQLLVPEPEPALPALLGGRYRLDHEIGRGGMARVHLAHDLRDDRSVAVKVLYASITSSLGRDRFLREIEIAARLRHPNVMPLLDSGQNDDLLYFVMPYEAGKSLKARLAQHGPLPTAEALACLVDVARALVHAHERGVVHRDIKPGNVLLSDGRAVVVDFGIAKALAEGQRPEQEGPRDPPQTLTAVGSSIGTPAYMSPEQWVGDPAIDHRTDIYSFGCLAYELFSGTPPFAESGTHHVTAARLAGRPRPLAEFRHDVAGPVVELIDRCLEIDPTRRPQHARDLLPSLVPSSGGRTTPSMGHRGPWRLLLLGILGVAALVAGLLFLGVGR